MQTDITCPDTVPRVLEALGGRKADLVVCDGAPDGTYHTLKPASVAVSEQADDQLPVSMTWTLISMRSSFWRYVTAKLEAQQR